MFFLNRYRWAGAVAMIAWIVIVTPEVSGQSPTPDPPPGSDQEQVQAEARRSKAAAATDQTKGQDLSTTGVSEEEVDRWIESLGSTSFATRETAATRLAEIGKPILEKLSEVSEKHHDPEVRIRAVQIVNQLTQGDLNRRVNAFLSGKDVPFEGWRTMRAIFGDTHNVREIFVEMLQVYPDVTTSLEGTSRDRAMALEKVVAGVRNKMFQELKFPSAADAISLLLPASDLAVPLDNGFDDVMLAVLYKPAVSELHRNIQMSRPLRVLIGRWLPRSSIKNRDETLTYGLSYEIHQTYELAVKTLTESQQTEILAIAMQAIAKFGSKNDCQAIAKFLDDKRAASERGFADGKPLRTELGDVAMATIARLHEIPLQEIGFHQESIDDKFAFSLDEIGFPIGEEEGRIAARKKIDELIQPATAAEEL